jgi:hypothetical protein
LRAVVAVLLIGWAAACTSEAPAPSAPDVGDGPEPSRAAEADSFPVAGVLVGVDDVTIRVTAGSRTDLPCVAGYEYRLEVSESVREVRLAVAGDPIPATTPPAGVGVACTGFVGPPAPFGATLQQPLAGRRVVDGAGGELRPVRRSEVLVPSPLPNGWIAKDESVTSVAGSAWWSQRFGPDPLTVMVYGLDVSMAWGTDCRGLFDSLIHGAEVTPVTVRGVPGERTADTRGPMLFWQENGACVQLWGMGSCTAAGCLAIDTDQLAALAESLRPPAA